MSSATVMKMKMNAARLGSWFTCEGSLASGFMDEARQPIAYSASRSMLQPLFVGLF
jgi:hypothetical protein